MLQNNYNLKTTVLLQPQDYSTTTTSRLQYYYNLKTTVRLQPQDYSTTTTSRLLVLPSSQLKGQEYMAVKR